MKTFTIIIPVYYNSENLPDTVPQLLSLQQNLPGYDLELIFVDDGSGDTSLEILLEFQKKYPHVIKVVKLARNFGSMAAIQAGFTVAQGDCVGMISADLQDPPELFLEMLKQWEIGNKAIFAVRQDREEPFLTKFFSNTYYSLVRKIALPDYPNGGFDFFAVDRQIIGELNRIQEKNTNIMSLIYWLGFRPIMIPYVRRSRKKGKSRWTFAKKFKLFVDTFVAFSYYPIRILSLAGLLIAIGSFVYGVFLLIYRMLYGIPVQGYVPTMLAITFTSGIQMMMLGVLGEYLWRTLDEVRRRPPFVIDEVYSTAKQPEITPTEKL
jgi:polyisoprenyl-phosphate glycosyltransferase